MQGSSPRILAIGAAVVGVSVALATHARGLLVILIAPPGPAAAAGNTEASADVMLRASRRIDRHDRQAPESRLKPLDPFVMRAKLSHRMRRTGQLQQYKGARAFQASLPERDNAGGPQWTGLRLSRPDSLPVIRLHPGIICAFGRGHRGHTQSTATAEIVTDLPTCCKPPLDISPFSSDRFA